MDAAFLNATYRQLLTVCLIIHTEVWLIQGLLPMQSRLAKACYRQALSILNMQATQELAPYQWMSLTVRDTTKITCHRVLESFVIVWAVVLVSCFTYAINAKLRILFVETKRPEISKTHATCDSLALNEYYPLTGYLVSLILCLPASLEKVFRKITATVECRCQVLLT